MLRTILQIALVIVTASTAGPQSRTPPKFDDYQVDSTYRGALAPVLLRSNPQARRYRTVLRDGARKGPNFAGHFTVVTWGCGTNCIEVGIVDAITGRVYIWPKAAGYGVEHHLNSSLLVVDRWDGCLPENSVAPDSATFLTWNGKDLRAVASVANRDICVK